MTRRTPILAALIACLTGMPSAAGEATAPEVVAHRVTEPPVIDGAISDAAYLAGRPLTRFHQLGSETAPAKVPSLALVVYDDEHLYVAMVMGKAPGRDISASYWRDGIEIFIDPGKTGDHYFQIAGNHDGVWSAEHPADGGMDRGWEPDVRLAGRTLASGLVVEAAIPFEALGMTPSPGDIWGVNICRNDAQAGHLTLAPLTRTFHEPRNFHRLKFGPERESTADTFDAGDSRSFEEFDEFVTRLDEQVDALPDEMPGRDRISDRVEAARATGAAVEREMEDHPVFAAKYGQWAYGFLLDEMKDDVRWRLRVAELFALDSSEASE